MSGMESQATCALKIKDIETASRVPLNSIFESETSFAT